jgi:nucleotide-binding universal stress UspA family protein
MNSKTFKKTKVIIALDYDPTAQKVAETGFSFAKSMGAEVTLLHVITDPAYYSSREYSPIMGFAGHTSTTPFKLDSIEGLKSASNHFLDYSKQHLDDKSIQTMVEEGDVADSILKAAKNIQADLIVLGSHSRKWLENIVLGSVSEKVLHHTKIPVLIIPTKKHK